jgi:hypothetical protein
MSSGQYEAMKGMGQNRKIRVFLGGTCNDSTWRDELIPKLTIEYFNPVVPDWNEEAYQEELRQREECDFVLYVITPRMEGVYSIAEVVDDSNKRPGRTLFCFLEKDKADQEEVPVQSHVKLLSSTKDVFFSKGQKKSLIATGNMIERNGAFWFKTMDDVVSFLNKY